MRLLKGLLFAALTIGIAAASLKILNYKDMGGGGGWTRFYAEQADIDVLFFGNSHAHCTVDHGYLWDHYGIAGYTMSAGAQNFAGTYYFVREALREETTGHCGGGVRGDRRGHWQLGIRCVQKQSRYGVVAAVFCVYGLSGR